MKMILHVMNRLFKMEMGKFGIYIKVKSEITEYLISPLYLITSQPTDSVKII